MRENIEQAGADKIMKCIHIYELHRIVQISFRIYGMHIKYNRLSSWDITIIENK
jgi:hypothetical protein